MRPPTDAEGRFIAQHRTAPIVSRLAAKGLDAFVCGVTTVGLSMLLRAPWASVLGVGWFCLADWSGSPGKWLLRLQVVMVPDGSPVTALASFKRNLVLGLPTLARACIVAGWTTLDADASKWDRGAVACVGLAVVLGELVGLGFHPEGRRWGDTFGRTRVVRR